jgi:hypothetical protein
MARSVDAQTPDAKPEAAVISYPDVCFAIEDAGPSDGSLEPLKLASDEDSYCVMLHVVQPGTAAAASGAAAAAPSTSGRGAAPSATATQPGPARQSVLFSAYCTSAAVHQYIGSTAGQGPRQGPSLLSWLLGRGPSREEARPQRHKVVLEGPGRVGRAEALATEVPVPPGGVGQPQLHMSLQWLSLPISVLGDAVADFAGR